MFRLVVIYLWAVLAAGTAMADAPWTGRWQLSWGNGGAIVALEQTDTAVSGSFGGGRIEGTVTGSRFDGQIISDGTTESLEATMSADGGSFTGTTESGDWLNGVRIIPGSPGAAALDITLDNPRDTLRSFLTAASLARSDMSYALSSALDAIDFGSAPDWTSREARFRAARQLFQLIDRATFNMSMIPDETSAQSLDLSLPVLDAKNAVSVAMRRDADGKWRIVMPDPDALRTALESGKPETADGFRQLQSPRDTLRAFLDGMEHWNTGGAAEALGTIDLSQVPEVLRRTEGDFVAQYLVRIINQVGQRTLQNVPNSGVSREPFVYFELPAGRIVIEPVGIGADTRWKFSAETARSIRNIYRAAEQLPDNNALGAAFIPPWPMFALRDQVKRFAPALLKSLPGPGQIEYWQLLASLTALAMVAVSTLVLRAVLLWLLSRPAVARHVPNARRLALGLAMGLSLLAASRFVLMVGLPAVTRQYTVPVFGSLLLLILAYALWQIVVLLLSLLQDLAEKTETAFDNIILTFTAGVAKLAIVIGTVMGLSYLWSLPTSGLLAGLGISGLAVAFASKETLANIFGAGILLGDRPFRKGDRIIAGDVNGWVEAVGLRSTRIRTMQDSLLVVPNGKLADMAVNNLGARRRRTLSTSIVVTAGGTPQRIETLARRIEERITNDPIFISSGTEVRVSRIFADGIEIEISSTLETRSGRASREATHKLYLDIMRLADELGLKLGRGTEAPAA